MTRKYIHPHSPEAICVDTFSNESLRYAALRDRIITFAQCKLPWATATATATATPGAYVGRFIGKYSTTHAEHCTMSYDNRGRELRRRRRRRHFLLTRPHRTTRS